MLAKLDDERKVRALTQLFSCLRKISDDLIIEARADSISFRALNETQSALPVIQVNSSFFEEYHYTHRQAQLAYQLPCQSVVSAMRSHSHSNEVTLSISTERRVLTITVFDRVQIKHEWSLYLERTSIMNAVFDMADVTGTLLGRVDSFSGTEAAFKRNENIVFALKRRGREKSCVLTTTDEKDTSARLCTITISANDNCEISLSEGRDEVSLSFSRRDFCVGLAIATVLAQRVTFHCIGAGYPVMMRASMPNAMQFQMAMASAVAEADPPPKAQADDEPLLTMPEREDRRTAAGTRTFASEPRF
jgi:hypothetical protein